MGNKNTTANQAALFSLRLRWALMALASLAAVTGGYFLVSYSEPYTGSNRPLQWILLASAGVLYLLLILWRGLRENRRVNQETLLPRLGPGSWLTLLRGLLVALLGGFLFMGRPQGWLLWAPGILYTLADLTDFMDGYAARVTNYQTRLGERLDMSFDSWGVLVGSALLVQYGQAPAWYLGVALARPLFLLGIKLRNRLNRPVYELPYRVERRALAGVQMGFIAALLWPVFTPPGTHIAAAVFALPFLLGFLRDWLITSGVLAAQNDSPAPARPWLPLGFRLGVVILGAAALWPRFATTPPPAPGFASLMLVTLVEVAVVAMIALGLSGRIAAIGGLLLLGVHQAFTGLDAVQILLIIGYTGVLFFGTGPFSLWKPEEWLIHHRAGERSSQLDPKGIP